MNWLIHLRNIIRRTKNYLWIFVAECSKRFAIRWRIAKSVAPFQCLLHTSRRWPKRYAILYSLNHMTIDNLNSIPQEIWPAFAIVTQNNHLDVTWIFKFFKAFVKLAHQFSGCQRIYRYSSKISVLYRPVRRGFPLSPYKSHTEAAYLHAYSKNIYMYNYDPIKLCSKYTNLISYMNWVLKSVFSSGLLWYLI